MKILSLIRLSTLAVAIGLLFSDCAKINKPAKPEQDSLLHVIEQYLQWEGENGFSGVILVKTPGNEPLIQSFGFANEEQNLLNTPQTVFNIGSLTKQFTGAAILKLEMEGRLSVEDSIGKYLMGLPANKQGITFHQLLTHTSGLPMTVGADSEVITKDVFLNMLRETPLIHVPGTTYHYSHAGYSLLGLLIEEISGTDYEAYLANNLFRPAGMKLTGYRRPDWSSATISHGYRFCNDWGNPMDAGWLEDGPSWHRRASGSMLSSIEDLYAWHKALLSNEILDERAKSKYYSPDKSVKINENQSAGYGWRILKTTRQTNLIAHNGWNGRYYSDFLRYLKEDVTIILLSNKFREGNQSMPFEIAKCIFRTGYEPKLTGSLTQCLDSLPNNRLGQLSRSFLTLMANGTTSDFTEFIEESVASHLIVKYGNGTLMSRLKEMQKQMGLIKIRQIMITDNQVMRIEVIQLGTNKEAVIQLYFDKNEDYRIRGFVFDSPEENQG